MEFKQLSPHVYYLTADHTTDRPLLGAVVGKPHTLVVDAGNSPAHAQILLDHLRTIDATPSFVMLTHWHWDHVFGTNGYDAPLLAHVDTQRVVREMASLDWSDAALDQRVTDGIEIEFCRDMIKAELPDRSDLVLRAPDIGFTDRLDLDLGGVTVNIVHVGGDHASDSTIVVVPDDKVVFLGDAIYPDLYQGPPNYTSAKTFPLLARLLMHPADIYLPAHHDEPLSHHEFLELTTLLHIVGETVDAVGDDRPATVANVETSLGRRLTDDELETIDEFLAGLRL